MSPIRAERDAATRDSFEPRPLTLRERILVHQVHPLKLAVDWGTAAMACVLFWRHLPWAATIVAIVPSVLVSAILVCRANLEGLKRSIPGRYVLHRMTPRMELVRFLGMGLLCVGAWTHSPVAMVTGLAVVVLGWVGEAGLAALGR